MARSLSALLRASRRRKPHPPAHWTGWGNQSQFSRSTKPRHMAKPSKISDVSLPQGQSILNKVISGYERCNLAGKISKNRHFCLAEVRAKREGKGPWGSRPAEIRKSSAIISARRATRFESPIGK
jgi:hypothetical protein